MWSSVPDDSVCDVNPVSILRGGRRARRTGATGPHTNSASTPAVVGSEPVPLASGPGELWRAQVQRPDLALWVAHCVEIRCAETGGAETGGAAGVGSGSGARLDVDRLRAASRCATAELGTGLVRLVEVDGLPHQLFDPTLDVEPDYLDLRDEASPRAAAEAWMRAELTGPVDFGNGRLARIAVLQIGDAHHLWFSRAHRTVLDGFGAVTLLSRAAELYDAATGGGAARPNRALAPSAIDDLDRGYAVSQRRSTDAAYWAERLAGAPVYTGLAGEVAPGFGPGELAPADGSRRGDLTVDAVLPGGSDLLVAAERRYGLGSAALAASALAAYLARVTGRTDLVLDLPVPARMGAGLRYSGGSRENTVPLRLHAPVDATVGELLADAHQALVGAVQHQQFRVAAGDGPVAHGPLLQVALSPREIRLTGLDVEIRDLSTSPVVDLRVELAECPDGIVRLGFTANPYRYDEGTLARHHRRFLWLFTRLLEAAPSDLIGELRTEPKVPLRVV